MASPPGRRAAVATSFVAALLTLGLLELVARLTVVPTRVPSPPASRTLDPYQANPFIVVTRPFLQTFIPGSRYVAARAGYAVDYEINAAGFRGPAVEAKRAPRLVVVGDSIAEGHGVPFDGAIPSLLGAALRGDGIEVVSAAMQGGSPLYYAANLPRYLALAPDAVLVVLYENDLWDDRGKEAVYGDVPLLDDADTLRLVMLAKRAWRMLAPTPVERRIAANRAIAPGVVADERFPWVLSEAEVERQFRLSAAYLDGFADALAARRVPLLVTFLAVGTLAPPVQPLHGVHAHALDREIRTWAAARGLPYLSLASVVTQAFAAGGIDDVMIPGDGHPTAAMQRRLAATLVPWVRESLASAGVPARAGSGGR